MSKELSNFLILTLSLFASIFISYGICKLLIYLQKKKRLSQPIHKLGVKEHFKKSGTPSLGGVAIFISTVFLFLLMNIRNVQTSRIYIILISSTGFFLVGLFDDLIKVMKKNEKGLNATLRIGIEIALALSTLVFMKYNEDYMLYLSLYPSNFRLFIGVLLVFVIVFAVVGASNSSNLMDGLDGLNGGVMMIAFTPILIFALKDGNYEMGLLVILVIGSLIGFLILNSHPAKIFMGDSGSLFLGSLFAWSLIYLDKLILLPFVGMLYIIEALSVILQVIYFKATKRRIFLMAPLHHHYELKAVPEYKIVMGYFLLQCVISVLVITMGVIF